MKLYVVNEKHSDPAKWSAWSEWSLVIAENEQQARELAGEAPEAPVCEVPLDRATLLVAMTEPNWGDDI